EELYIQIILYLICFLCYLFLTTVSQVSVKAGESISIPCLYDSQYETYLKYLCKGYYYRECTYAVKTNQPGQSGKYSISDDKKQRIFTVTIKKLNADQDSHYWCAVEIPGIWKDVRVYFHLSVTRGPPSFYVDHQDITGFDGGNITIKFYSTQTGKIKWCKLGSECVTQPTGSIDGTRVSINESAHNVFTVTMSRVTTKSSGWYLCYKGDLQVPVHLTVNEAFTPSKYNNSEPEICFGSLTVLIISLTLLIFFVTVSLVIWFLLKRSSKFALTVDETSSFFLHNLTLNVDDTAVAL
uniref:Immunoglobulin domain-containing protein n=1 Tax=Haplochromis burtoni TaxID=8153 RepID=A0A3Q2W147_HAPBU